MSGLPHQHRLQDMREMLSQSGSITIPLLSYDSHDCGQFDATDATVQRVCSAYAEQVTCQSCHSNTLPPGHAFLKRKL